MPHSRNFLGALTSILLLISPLQAGVGSTVRDTDRYEIFEISVKGATLVRLDRYSGETHEYSGRPGESNPWVVIRNDHLPASRTANDKITYQIFSSPLATILYNIHDGRTWFLSQGPTGYNLYWKKTP
jgi:hypothetical protein